MSDTTAPATTASTANRAAEWGPVITTGIFGGAFLAAVIWAYVANDAQSKSVLLTAVITNATTAVNWWLGSSSGSQKKDAVIGAIAQAAPPAGSKP